MKLEWRYDGVYYGKPSYKLLIDGEYRASIWRSNIKALECIHSDIYYVSVYGPRDSFYADGLLTAQALLLERLGITTVLSSEESDHE